MPIEKIAADSPEARSADIVQENLERLRELFPEAFKDGDVDFDVLHQLLGDEGDESEEKFGLNWHGKKSARKLALTPSAGTLRPVPEDSQDWDTTKNIVIEGDNLEVLKLLQKSYAGRVKLIYIDPPYNTGKDFVYPDNYHDSIRNYLELTAQVEDGRRVSSNTEASGRFHTDWLNMMYPRLRLARNLLRRDGVVFISIDDMEVASLKFLCDEVFGADNFEGFVIWQHSVQPKGYSGHFSVHHNFLLCYRRSDKFELTSLPRTDEHNKNYSNPDNDPRGPWRSGDVRNALYRPNLIYDLRTPSGKTIKPPEKGWRWSRDTMAAKIATGEIVFADDETRIVRKIYLAGLDGRTPETIWFGKEVGTTRQASRELKRLFDGDVPFDTAKPLGLIRRVFDVSGVEDGDIVCDFFAGSGTTAEAVMEMNAEGSRNVRFILVQLPEVLDRARAEQRSAAAACENAGRPPNLAELTKERLVRARERIGRQAPGFGGDLGFRTFRLDGSNIRPWDSTPENLEQILLEHEEHILPERTETDVLYEVLLKLGLDLCVETESREVAGLTVHSIGAGVLFACLSPHMTALGAEEVATSIGEWRRELSPAGDSTAVFRDSAFESDVAKANLVAILEQAGIAKVRSL
ncbi:MAG: site-specific DNA-methyltransferase [Gemmatimonadales bacterium]|nr:MAG: site-specific DNA-methyltransferase [Gemmatimonadales bacterium]